MKLAPIQLIDYFVHSLEVKASADFNKSEHPDLDSDTLELSARIEKFSQSDENHYYIDLSIEQKLIENKNIPYSYRLQMVGFVDVHPEYPKDKILRAVEINGSSMLFGAAREIIRAATSRGPHGPVLIPSTSFYNPPKELPKKGTVKVITKKKAKRATSKKRMKSQASHTKAKSE